VSCSRRPLPVLLLVAVLAVSLLAPAASASASSRTPVMQRERLTAEQMASWFEARRPATLPYRASVPPLELARLYLEEGRAEGIAGDIAFVQSVLETAYFNFPSSGQVRPEHNNFAGIGACDGGTCTVASFPSARIGVRAQIQHLRAYADPTVTASNLAYPLESPRFHLVTPKGMAPAWEEFGGGRWATDPAYADKILGLYVAMLRHADAASGGRVGSFADVRRAHTHFPGIESIARDGVTTGCTSWAYCPAGVTTRGQMASFLVRALDLPLSDQDRFDDVRGTHRRAINALAEAGITRGCAPGRFCPHDPVNRGEMAAFLQRALGLRDAKAPFSDVAGTPHAKAIGAVTRAGIANGYDDGTYRPFEPLSRAQMASLLDRAPLG
jgi:hypothetical protein